MEIAISTTVRDEVNKYFDTNIGVKNRSYEKFAGPRSIYFLVCVYIYGNRNILGSAAITLNMNRTSGYNSFKKKDIFLSDPRLNMGFHHVYDIVVEKFSTNPMLSKVKRMSSVNALEIPSYGALKNQYNRLALQSLMQKTNLLKAVAMASRSPMVDSILQRDAKMYANLGSDSTKVEREVVKDKSRENYREIMKYDHSLGQFLLETLDK